MEMSALSKRREKFMRQIRTKEREIIKRELRAQLLSEEGMLDQMSSLCPSNEISLNPMSQFEQEMFHFLASRFSIQTMDIITSDLVLSLFCKSISEIYHSQGIIYMTECFKSAKSIIHNHSDLIASRKSQGNSDFDDCLEKMNRWSHVLNIFLLRIKLKSLEFPKEIFQIEEQFDIWLHQALEGLRENHSGCLLLQKKVGEGEDVDFKTVKDIHFILKQIQSLLEGQQDYKRKETVDLLERVFNYEMVNFLVASIINYNNDGSCRLISVEILLGLTQKGLKTIYQHMIDNDITYSIRFACEYGEECIWKLQDQASEKQKLERNLISKICDFIVSGSLLFSSDLFWQKGKQKGVCCELKNTVFNDGIIQQCIISTLFVCITNISKKETFDIIEEQETFEWVLRTIDWLISKNSSNPKDTELIDQAVRVIHFFLEFGECKRNEQTANPFKIELQRYGGEFFLSRCQTGSLLLQKYYP